MSTPKRRVLVIDDDSDFASSLSNLLTLENYEVATANSASEAERLLGDFNADLVLIDIRPGHDEGLKLSDRLRRIRPDLAFIMVTAHAAVDTAVAAMHQKAFDYLRKPFDFTDLLDTLERSFRRLEQERGPALLTISEPPDTIGNRHAVKGRLLLVEDDTALNQILAAHFEDAGFRVTNVFNLAEAKDRLHEARPDVVLLDQHLPDGNGLDLLPVLLDSDTQVIMMTGVNDLELAIQAIQLGAFDFIHKPVKTEELDHLLNRALEYRKLARKAKTPTGEDAERCKVSLSQMIGQSDAMLRISKEIALVAASDARVLITGESGTGKELVARAIHTHSHRQGPFLGVNCAAFVDTLLESELFGHEKGAFTGALQRKPGKFELASDGTLFLDEIGELALALQAKLLRVLQEGCFERVGGTQQLTTRARVITATNRDLENEVEAGRFREDLLYRLKVFHIHVPPLRQRREDIPLLAKALLERSAQTLRRAPPTVTDAAMAQLQQHDWPGNVRELENVITQALVRSRDRLLTPELLLMPAADAGLAARGLHDPFRTADGRLLSLDEVEALHIQKVLNETSGHKGRSCEILGISRPALDRKIQKYDLRVVK